MVKLILYIIFFTGTAAIYIATGLKYDWMKNTFSYGGYYIVFALVSLWAWTIIKTYINYRGDIRAYLKKYRKGVVISLLLTIVIFLSVTPSFRVLSDETNLLAVSKSMVYEKRVDNVTMGKWYYDSFYPINREMQKRPLVFPFFASILHTFLGYRPENLFLLNAIALFAFFLLIYIAFKNRLGEVWAASALLLVASQPIVIQDAASGGFDFLAALFLLIVFMALQWFLKDPTALKFQLLWVTLLMVANIRYEGIAIFAIVILFLSFFRYIKLKFFRDGSSLAYLLTPLILAINIWPTLLEKNHFETTTEKAFSIKYLVDNSAHFLRSFLDYRFFLPYAGIVNAVGFFALLYFGWRFIFRRLPGERRDRHLIVISAVCMLVMWVLYASFYNGTVDHPTCARYYAIFCISLSVLALLLMHHLAFFRKNALYALALCALMLVIYHPVSVQDRFSRTQLLPREYRFVMEFLKKADKEDKSFLVITDRPGQYTVHNFGAVNFDLANSDNSLYSELSNHLYEKIYVIQEILYATGKPTTGTELDSRYSLETLTESQHSDTCFTRISKVISIKEK